MKENTTMPNQNQAADKRQQSGHVGQQSGQKPTTDRSSGSGAGEASRDSQFNQGQTGNHQQQKNKR